MQVVILAAGRGTRMGALTDTTPKPLLPIWGDLTLLEQKFHVLPPQTKEVIVALGYRGEEIRSYLGDEYAGVPIRYAYDNEMTGTGGTTWKTRDLIEDDFMVLMSDDLYQAKDLAALAQHRYAMLGQLAEAATGDFIDADSDGNFVGLVGYQTYQNMSPNRSLPSNTGAYKLHRDIFQHPLVEYKPGEYGLPQTIAAAVATADLPVKVLSTRHWQQVNTPEQYDAVKQTAHHYFRPGR